MNRVFRAAVEQVVNNADSGRLRDRFKKRPFLQACRTLLDAPYLMDVLYEANAESIEATVLDESVSAIGDGALLDQLARYVKWLIDHADEVERFIQMILKVVAAIVAMFV